MSCPGGFPGNICGTCPLTELLEVGSDCGKNVLGGKAGNFEGREEFSPENGDEMW